MSINMFLFFFFFLWVVNRRLKAKRRILTVNSEKKNYLMQFGLFSAISQRIFLSDIFLITLNVFLVVPRLFLDKKKQKVKLITRSRD